VSGEHDLLIVAIVLDDIIETPLADGLRTLLADRAGFAGSLRSVGLLGLDGWRPAALGLGCDVLVNDADQALDAILLLRDAWRDTRRRSPAWMPLVETPSRSAAGPSALAPNNDRSAPSPSRRVERRAGEFGEAPAPP